VYIRIPCTPIHCTYIHLYIPILYTHALDVYTVYIRIPCTPIHCTYIHLYIPILYTHALDVYTVYIYALLYTATLWGDTVADVRRDGHEPTMGTALDHEFYPSFLYTSECSILGERLPTRVNTYPFAVACW